MATNSETSRDKTPTDASPSNKNPDTITLYEARPPKVEDPISVAWMLADLAKSGLDPEDVRAYPTSSIAMNTVGCYVLGYERPEMWVKRFDRSNDKYIGPKGLTDVWHSPYQDIKKFHLADTLYIIEGEKKAARFVKQWPMLNVLGIRGCRGFSERGPNNNPQLARKILESIRPSSRVIAIFDGDIETNPQVKQAGHVLDTYVQVLGTQLEVFRPPLGKGVDDWLQEEANPELTDLIDVDLGTVEENRKQILRASGVKLDDEGKFVKNENNAVKVINYIFKNEIRNDKRLGLIHQGQTGADAACIETDVCLWMQEHIAAHFSMSVLSRAYSMFLQTVKTDLVQQLVRNLEWDGVARLDTWGSKYFKSKLPVQADDWGRLLMTGLTLRILEPGTKVDYAFILVGPQGIGKTTALEDLSTFDGFKFYSPLSEIPKGGGDATRTMAIQFNASVIVDLAEGMVFDSRISSVEAVKQLISQTEDSFRQVYSKHSQVDKRGFIFCGTTNRRDHLSDASGSRRYQNLEATSIVRLPYAEKMQLMAEVVAKRHELIATEWYRPRITLDQLPQELRDANPHITNAQELVNTQYRKPDVIEDDILSLLESGECATLKEDTEALVLTAVFVCVKSGSQVDVTSRNRMSRTLNFLASSQTFPYHVSTARKRINQLNATEAQMFAYSNIVTNNQGMLNVFICKKKVL